MMYIALNDYGYLFTMRTLIITVLFVFTAFPLLSQQEDVPSYEETLALYEDLFSAEEPLILTLRFDVKALQKTRHQDVYHEAVMIHMVGSEFQVTHSVQVKARETIRQKICALPPMWLNIGNSGIKTDSLQDGFRMNMVLRCKNAAQFEPYVLREYLAYKIYNIITPLSYRVRLVKLSIIDTGKGNKVTEDWALLQEPDGLLTQRLNGKMIKNDKLSMSMLNPEVLNSLSMFQYMIGNPDYAVTGRHKLKIMALNSGNPSGFLPVPYDFDYSGLVNTDYAIPAKPLGITSVRERYYLGPCRPEKVHKETVQELALFEDKILAYIKDFEYLDEKERVDMIGYLDSYFKASMESWFIDQNITPTCR
jgi:hypothetical protein